MGRGVFFCGRWATAEEAPRHLPPERRRPACRSSARRGSWAAPSVACSTNAITACTRPARPRHHAPAGLLLSAGRDPELEPAVRPAGFTQHQCVLPEAAGPQAVRRSRRPADASRRRVVSVRDQGLRRRGRRTLSFPARGITIALDLPVRANTQRIIDTLNEFVIAAGGRVYLAKDAFTRPEHYRAMEPRLSAWQAIRRRWDPQGRLRSAQSVRLLGDAP